MKQITTQYINGEFVPSHGVDQFDLINPSSNAVIGQVSLADERDTQYAISAAKTAFKNFSKTTKQQRSEYLRRMYDAVMARSEELIDAVMEEYGAPYPRAKGATLDAAGTGRWDSASGNHERSPLWPRHRAKCSPHRWRRMRLHPCSSKHDSMKP
jgi:aldehyde dehydrogenase (NAD+)